MACYTLSQLYSKDESQNFVAQLRDSSDVTKMIKQQAVRMNYVNLHDKASSPVGGIPSEDLYNLAHTTGAYAPMSSMMSGISMQPCVSCTGQFPFNLVKVSLSMVRY